MDIAKIKIKRTSEHDLPCPEYATDGSAAFDLRANLESSGDLVIHVGEHTAIPTGFAFEIPKGCVGIVCARSGLAAKNALNLTNGIGVIDSDFRGEVKVLLSNCGDADFTVTHGMRVAQMMIMPYIRAEITEEETLSSTDRGEGGFGSTGTV